jgi:hypothetical protein
LDIANNADGTVTHQVGRRIGTDTNIESDDTYYMHASKPNELEGIEGFIFAQSTNG